MALQLLDKMEKTLARKEAVLAEMKAKGERQAPSFEMRVVGYRNAVDDLRFSIDKEVDDMAEAYGEG